MSHLSKASLRKTGVSTTSRLLPPTGRTNFLGQRNYTLGQGNSSDPPTRIVMDDAPVNCDEDMPATEMPAAEKKSLKAFEMVYALGLTAHPSVGRRARAVFQFVANHINVKYEKDPDAKEKVYVKMTSENIDEFCLFQTKGMLTKAKQQMLAKFKAAIATIICEDPAKQSEEAQERTEYFRRLFKIDEDAQLTSDSIEEVMTLESNTNLWNKLYKQIDVMFQRYYYTSRYHQMKANTPPPNEFLDSLSAGDMDRIKRRMLALEGQWDRAAEGRRFMTFQEMLLASASYADAFKAFHTELGCDPDKGIDVQTHTIPFENSELPKELRSKNAKGEKLYNWNLYSSKFDPLWKLGLEALTEKGYRWAHEKDIHNGGKDRFYRVAGRYEGFFEMGKGAYAIPTTLAQAFELESLRIANDLILAPFKKVLDMACGFVGEAIGRKNEVKETVEYEWFDMVLAQVMANGPQAGYSMHDDKGADNTKARAYNHEAPGEEARFVREHLDMLPLDWQQMIITFSMVYEREDITGNAEDRVDNSEPMKTKLLHYKNACLKTPVSEMESNFNGHRVTATLQGIGMQKLCKHEVVDIQVEESASGQVRLICSVRAAVPYFAEGEAGEAIRKAIRMNWKAMYPTKPEFNEESTIRPRNIYKYINPFGKEKQEVLKEEEMIPDARTTELESPTQPADNFNGDMREEMQRQDQQKSKQNKNIGFSTFKLPLGVSEYVRDADSPAVCRSGQKPLWKCCRNYLTERILRENGLHMEVDMDASSVKRRKKKAKASDVNESGTSGSKRIKQTYNATPYKCGDIVDIMDRRDKNFTCTQQHKSICDVYKEYADMFVLLQKCKNVYMDAVRFAVIALSDDPNAILDLPGSDDMEHHNHIGVGPSGGGFNKAGTFAQDRAGVSTSNVVEKTETAKQVGDFQPFAQGLEMSSAVSMFCPISWVWDAKKDFERRKAAGECVKEFDGIDFDMIRDDVFPDDYDPKKDDRAVCLGYFYFWNIRTTKDYDPSDLLNRTYGMRVVDENDKLSFWGKVPENSLCIMKPMYHGGVFENGVWIHQPAPAPPCVREGLKTKPLKFHEREFAMFQFAPGVVDDGWTPTEAELTAQALLHKIQEDEDEGMGQAEATSDPKASGNEASLVEGDGEPPADDTDGERRAFEDHLSSQADSSVSASQIGDVLFANSDTSDSTILGKYFSACNDKAYELTTRAFQTLKPGQWLNDEVINLYRAILNNGRDARWRNEATGQRTYCFPTQFMQQFHGKDGKYCYANVKRWSRSLPVDDIFSLEKAIFPFNPTGNHWMFVVASMEKDKRFIAAFDSNRNRNRKASLEYCKESVSAVWMYLQEEWKENFHTDLGRSGPWKFYVHGVAMPQQKNGFDCGIFTCMGIEKIFSGGDFDFSQEHALAYRAKMAVALFNIGFQTERSLETDEHMETLPEEDDCEGNTIFDVGASGEVQRKLPAGLQNLVFDGDGNVDSEAAEALKNNLEYASVECKVDELPLDGALSMLALIGTASFCRYRNMHLDRDSSEQHPTVGYLWRKQLPKLGWNLCTRSAGHPNRCMNINTLNMLLMYTTEEPTELRYADDVRQYKMAQKLDHWEKMDRIFRATLNKLAPSVGLMSLYRRWCTRNPVPEPILDNADKEKLSAAIPESAKAPVEDQDQDFSGDGYVDRPYIPAPFHEAVDHFKTFLKELADFHNNKDHKMAPFVKTLHKKALPEWSHGDIDSFINGMHVFLDSLHRLFADKEKVMRWKYRDNWIEGLGDELESLLTNPDDGKPVFVMSLAILDVEETAFLPFGEGIDPFFGSGGIRGFNFLYTPEQSKEDKYAWCKYVLKYMEDHLCQDVLDALGFYRQNVQGIGCKLFNKINGNMIQIWHLDHLLCKLSFVESLTTGSRLVSQSKTSGLEQPYEWHAPFMWMDFYAGLMVLQAASKDAIAAFERYGANCDKKGRGFRRSQGFIGFAPPPEQFKFVDEDIKWPKVVEMIQEWDKNKREAAANVLKRAEAAAKRKQRKRVRDAQRKKEEQERKRQRQEELANQEPVTVTDGLAGNEGYVRMNRVDEEQEADFTTDGNNNIVLVKDAVGV